jgi:hypothetical protein
MRFTGIIRPEEFRIVTRAHVIAWRDDFERRQIGRDNKRNPAGCTIRNRLAALSSLFEYLASSNYDGYRVALRHSLHFHPVAHSCIEIFRSLRNTVVPGSPSLPETVTPVQSWTTVAIADVGMPSALGIRTRYCKLIITS